VDEGASEEKCGFHDMIGVPVAGVGVEYAKGAHEGGCDQAEHDGE